MPRIKDNYWVKSGFYTIAQRLSIPVFGVGSFLIIIRSLTEAEMGAWVLFLSIVTAIEVARNGLVKAALVRYYNTDKFEQRTAVKSAAFFINIVYTILTSLSLFLASEAIATVLNSSFLTYMLQIYCLSSILMIAFTHFEYVQQANMQFKGIFYSYFTKQGSFFMIIFGLIMLIEIDLTPSELVIIHAISIFLGALTSWKHAHHLLSYHFKFTRSYNIKLWHFGKFGFLTNVSNSALTTTDHLMIGGMLSSASVATYSVAARITNLFVIPSVAIADILYPKTVHAEANEGNKGVKTLYENAVGATLVPMLPILIFVLCFPEQLISLLAGEKYIDASPVLRITIFGIILLPFLKQFGTVMNAINRPNYNFYFVLSLSVFNLITNFYLVPLLGITGAAVATLGSYFVGFIASQLILNKLLAISTISTLKQTIFFMRKALQITISKISHGK